MDTKEVVLLLIEASQQVRVFHWNTKSYAEHVALGSLYEAIDASADEIAETLIGLEDKRPVLSGTIQLSDYRGTDSVRTFLKALSMELEAFEGSTDVLNLRDDLLAKVHKTLYLLSLDGEEEEEGEEEGEEPTEKEEPPPKDQSE